MAEIKFLCGNTVILMHNDSDGKALSPIQKQAFKAAHININISINTGYPVWINYKCR